MTNALPTGFSFDVGKHEYRLGTTVVPSCTTILSSSGLVPSRYISADLFERRTELGKQVHLACHLHNVGKLGTYDPKVKPHLHAWITFKERCKSFTLISSEYQTVVTIAGMSYGMQPDVNAFVDGYDTVIELKIGKVYPHHAVQTAGYAAGLPHPKFTAPLGRFMARKRMVVELQANGLPDVHPHEQKSDFDVFMSLLYLETWKRRFEPIYKEKI